jgi:hypothetical protein
MDTSCSLENSASRVQQAMAQQRAEEAQRAQAAQKSANPGQCGQQDSSQQAQQQRQPVDPATQQAARQTAQGNEAAARCRAQQPPQCTPCCQARRGLQQPGAGSGGQPTQQAPNQTAQQPPTATPQSCPAQPPANGTQQPAQPAAQPPASLGDTTMRRGSRGDNVRALQTMLNARGANPPLAVDGRFGPLTDAAVRNHQRQNGQRADGVVGPRTREQLRTSQPQPGARPGGSTTPGGATTGPNGPTGTNPTGNPNNNTATFDRVTGQGQRNQMVSGRITVNGNTYNFNSGGSGRGNLPAGDYQISNLRNRNTAGMVRDGVGF